MKRVLLASIGLLLIVSAFVIIFYGGNSGRFTGGSVSNEENAMGPSTADQTCMMQCMGCSSPGIGCTGDSNQCMQQCNVEKPEQTAEESCVETCVLSKGCGEFEFSCQSQYQDECDEECGMIKEPEAKSEEERCIRDCVNSHAPETICKPSQEGEQGNDVCQMCAQQCVHLYEGPCLDDEKLKAKQKECETCEHCYGEPIMGDSGEGWECLVDVECRDASSEFGDNPGTGEGIVSKVGDSVVNVIESIGNFFSGIFGGGDETPNQNLETVE